MFAVHAPLLKPMQVEVFDTTLREGSYVVDFQLDEKFVIELLGQLDKTPIQKIEIGHGIGYEAERAGITPCNIDLRRWCEIARAELTSSSWGMFAQPEFSQLSTLEDLCAQGMHFVRIGISADQVPDNLDYVGRATEICGQVYLNLMKSSDTPAERIPELLSGLTSAIAGLYIVDSLGSMLPTDIPRYITAAKQCCPVVGFHGHDNLGLANANSIAALDSGATIVDGTLAGVGRGSGNAATEALAGILSLVGDDRYSYRTLARIAEFSRSNLAGELANQNLQVLGGVIGIHSGYFPLIEKICVENYLDPASLMETAVELADYSVGRNHIYAAAELIVQRGARTESQLADAISGGTR